MLMRNLAFTTLTAPTPVTTLGEMVTARAGRLCVPLHQATNKRPALLPLVLLKLTAALALPLPFPKKKNRPYRSMTAASAASCTH